MQNTPSNGTPGNVAQAGTRLTQQALGGIAAQVSSQAGADFGFRIAEGIVSCLSIICALAMPVAVLTVTVFGSVSMQFTAFDIIQLPAKYKDLFGGMLGSSGSSSEAQAVASLSIAAMAFAVVLVAAVVCSAVTAYFCFTKNSAKRYPTSWVMAVYAAILIVAFIVISIRLAGEVAKAGGGFIDVSNAFRLDMGLGIWVPLIGGIACIVLDFMRVSRASQAPGVNQPPMA